MKYEEFKSELINLVSEEIEARGLEDISLKNTTIDSPDSTTDRLMVTVGESKMSMAFRLKDIFKDVEDGEDINDATRKIVNTIQDNISVVQTKEEDVKSFITDYEKVKDHTYLRLIPGDSPILKDTPHRMIVDMALVTNIHLDDLSDENGRSVVVVSKPLMEMYGITEEKLFADAEKNSLKHEPLVFKTFHDLLSDFFEEEKFPTPNEAGIVSYITTNTSGFHGASVITYPGVLKKAAETMGGGFYLLPSSVHEFILIRDDGGPNARALSKMVTDINETVLEPKDFLSDHVYHYSLEYGLETGISFDDRMKEAS